MGTRPSQLGRYRAQKWGRMDSLKTFLTFSGVTSKHFWISLVLMFSSCIFSWFLQISLRAILSLQRRLCSQIFQKAMAAMVLMRTSSSAALTMRSHISIMARSSSILILRLRQTRMITCLGFMMGTKSILNFSTMFISFIRSFQSFSDSPITFEMLNYSKQFSFQKQAEQIAYPAMFLMERMFLCFSRFSFLRYSESSSPNSSPFSRLSFSRFSWFMMRRMVRQRAVATSLMFWLSLRTKQQSAMILRPFLKDLSKLASFSSSMPPLSSVFEQSVVKRFSRRSSPQQCITSLSQLIGCTSTKVHSRIPHTLAPFSSRTEWDLHLGHSINYVIIIRTKLSQKYKKRHPSFINKAIRSRANPARPAVGSTPAAWWRTGEPLSPRLLLVQQGFRCGWR